MSSYRFKYTDTGSSESARAQSDNQLFQKELAHRMEGIFGKEFYNEEIPAQIASILPARKYNLLFLSLAAYFYIGQNFHRAKGGMTPEGFQEGIEEYLEKAQEYTPNMDEDDIKSTLLKYMVLLDRHYHPNKNSI